MDNQIDLIKEFLKENFIMTIATVDGNEPYANTVFYVTKDSKTLYYTSSRKSIHCQNILKNSNVAGNLFVSDTLNGYEKGKVGLQFKGTTVPVTNKAEAIIALTMYGKKFVGAKTWYKDAVNFIKDGEIYKIMITKAKLFNTNLGLKATEYLEF